MKKGTESKATILDVALGLFVRKGFHGVSISDLARSCSVSKGALYHHFASKDDIYRQAVAWYFQRRMEKKDPGWFEHPEWTIDQTIEAGFASIQTAKSFVRSIAGEGDDAILRFYAFLYEATRLYPEFQEQMDRADSRKQSGIASRLREAQTAGTVDIQLDARLIAIELDLLIQQLAYMSFVNPDLRDHPQRITELCQSFLHRLRPRSEPGRVS